ncbi:MAG TPA: type II secretion system protein [Patescibacteria group bacterium]
MKINNKNLDNRQHGFTLIELLIVIAIIGILATLLMTNFIGVRQRARDAQRKSDVRQMQSALELYRADNGSYPAAVGSNGLSTTCPTPQAFANGGTTYMAQVPCDPLGSSYYHSGNYFYKQVSNGYEIGACLENSADTDYYSGAFDGSDSSCSTGHYYVKTNP